MIYVSTFLFKLPADFCHDQVSFPLHLSRSLSPLSLPISLSMYPSFYPPCLLCHCACLFVCILAVSSHAFLCLPTTLTPSLRFFLCLFIALFFPPHDPCLAIKQMYCVSVLLLIVVWLFIILIFCLCSSSSCSFDVSKLLHKTVNSPLLGTFVTSLPVFRSMCLPFFFSVCLSVCLFVCLSVCLSLFLSSSLISFPLSGLFSASVRASTKTSLYPLFFASWSSSSCLNRWSLITTFGTVAM